MQTRNRVSLALALLLSFSLGVSAETSNRVEQQLRDRFPSVSIESTATFDAAAEFAARGTAEDLERVDECQGRRELIS